MLSVFLKITTDIISHLKRALIIKYISLHFFVVPLFLTHSCIAEVIHGQLVTLNNHVTS